MDTTNLTKVVATVCVAGLVFLFGKWGAETIFSAGEPKAAHGEHADDGHGESNLAYAIETEAGDDHTDENAGPAWLVAMSAADPAAGEKVFGKCRACHKLEEGAHGAGPSLAGLFGRKPGTVAGFGFSDAMIAYGETTDWNEEALFNFLTNVKGTVPSTKMSFAGLKEADAANIIAFFAGDKFDAGAYMVEAAAGGEAGAEAAADHGDEAMTEEAQTEEVAALPAGDAEAGAKVFNKCKACHKVEAGKNGAGPSLFGIFGATPGSVEGFNYSDAMIEFGASNTWDAATLSNFLGDVRGTVPGTRMSFAGIKDEQQRADLIAYLATVK